MVRISRQKIENLIHYQGLDEDNKIHYLSDDRIEINFKDRWARVYNQMWKLKPEDKYFTLPSGSRKHKNMCFPLKTITHWANVRFVQNNDPSCLFCSIVSAMYHLKYFDVVYTLFEVYHKKISMLIIYHV